MAFSVGKMPEKNLAIFKSILSNNSCFLTHGNKWYYHHSYVFGGNLVEPMKNSTLKFLFEASFTKKLLKNFVFEISNSQTKINYINILAFIKAKFI